MDGFYSFYFPDPISDEEDFFVVMFLVLLKSDYFKALNYL